MTDEKEVDMQSLVGKHLLSGVDESELSVEQYSGHFENCQCINFILDGITYTAIENPEDGYRSCLDNILITETKVTNKFAPVEVLVSYLDKQKNEYYSEDCDLLEFVDTKNGKLVLQIGTGNTNDYYPYFVASWTPENLSVNG
jgi:hypothetical protein